jgi:glycoprotein 6-alpha-L-fucosyltransferase
MYNHRATLKSSKFSRDSHESLGELIKDILILANCDYVVCTFSSNLCRLVYELKQTEPTDATWRVTSLDSDYYYDASFSEHAIHDHLSANEDHIELKIGDVVEKKYITYPPGFSIIINPAIRIYNIGGLKLGFNLRTKKTGFYPAFKTTE